LTNLPTNLDSSKILPLIHHQVLMPWYTPSSILSRLCKKQWDLQEVLASTHSLWIRHRVLWMLAIAASKALGFNSEPIGRQGPQAFDLNTN
jgi:hypothetical protein